MNAPANFVIGGQAFGNGVMIQVNKHTAISKRLRDGRIVTKVRGPNLLESTKEVLIQLLCSIPAVIVLVGCLFVLSPAVALWTAGHFTSNLWAIAGMEPLITLFVVLSSLALLRLHPRTRRSLQYHAAEHQAIHAAETYNQINPELARQCPIPDIYCGSAALALMLVTNFLCPLIKCWLLCDMCASMDGFVLASLMSFAGTVTLSGLLFLAGPRWRWTHVFLVPGLWLQKFTTYPPDKEHLEVACAAVRAAMEAATTAQPVLAAKLTTV